MSRSHKDPAKCCWFKPSAEESPIQPGADFIIPRLLQGKTKRRQTSRRMSDDRINDRDNVLSHI